MRIAHVVTYISPDGAFGGPSRVALGQAEALAALGHEVEVFAAAPVSNPEERVAGAVRIHLFPARSVSSRLGFAGMYAPGLTRALRGHFPRLDAIHVHLARDLVTLPAARAARTAGKRLIVQPHGMIDASDKILAAVIDRLEVRRSLRGAAEVLVLTEEERAQIIGIEPGASIGMITNGLRNVPATPLGERGGDVVFMARLHPRKRPDAFVRMAADVVQRGYESTQFVLAGPDEGMLEVVQSEIARLGVQRNVRWIGAVDPSRTDQLLANAAVYVLPSVGEVFPMSVLEAFRAGTPTVVTDSLGIAEMCIAYGAAIVTDGSEASLADAVAELLSVPARVEALRVGSKALLDGELGIDRVAARLVEAYGG